MLARHAPLRRITEHGSLAGDELLILSPAGEFALRSVDVLARTGGNEFCLLVFLRRGIRTAEDAAPFRTRCRPRSVSELAISAMRGRLALMQPARCRGIVPQRTFAVKQAAGGSLIL